MGKRVEQKFSFACSYLPGFEGCARICPIPNFGAYLKQIGYDVEEIAFTLGDHEENAGLTSDKDASNYDALIALDIKKGHNDIPTNVIFYTRYHHAKKKLDLL